jgi:hypothetical protein
MAAIIPPGDSGLWAYRRRWAGVETAVLRFGRALVARAVVG